MKKSKKDALLRIARATSAAGLTILSFSAFSYVDLEKSLEFSKLTEMKQIEMTTSLPSINIDDPKIIEIADSYYYYDYYDYSNYYDYYNYSNYYDYYNYSNYSDYS